MELCGYFHAVEFISFPCRTVINNVVNAYTGLTPFSVKNSSTPFVPALLALSASKHPGFKLCGGVIADGIASKIR